MDSLSIYLLLDYLYNKFAVTFILSLVGVSIREIVSSINEKQPIRIGRIIVSSIFSTISMCALSDYIHLNFSIYVLICVIYGMWSIKIVSFVLTTKFANIVLKSVSKNAKGIASDVLKNVIDDNVSNDTTATTDKDTKDNNSDPKKE